MKVFDFDKVQFIFFFFVTCDFGVGPTKLLLNPIETYAYGFF